MSRTPTMVAVIVLCMGAIPLHAQGRDSTASGTGTPGFRPIAISGEIGAYGELYSMSGRDARRPSSLGRLFFRPTVTLFEALSLDFDVMVSTEGTSARQDINQFGLNPSWSWGQAHIGDFTDNYAQYTLNGIRIRGGGFFINPGLFRLGAVGGVTRRAVLGGADNGAYDRYLWGGRIGIGSGDASSFDLIFLRVRDKVSSLSPDQQVSSYDSTSHLYTTPAFETTPQENALVGMMTHLTFLNDHITWDVEATGSVYTRDMRVGQNAQLTIPDWINDLYHLNITSSAGVALRTELGVTTGVFSVNTGYRYITPGYMSLGVASLVNDWQEFSVSPSLRLGHWSLQVGTMRQNDNLFGQKLNTLVRWQNSASITFQPNETWSSTILGNTMSMTNEAVNDTFKVNYGSLTLGTNQYLNFAEGSAIRSVMLTYLYQRSGNEPPLGRSTVFTSHAGNLGLTIPLTRTLSLLPGAGFVISQSSGATQQTTQTYTLAAQHRTWEDMLVTVLSGVMSTTGGSSSFRSMLSSTYRLTRTASVGVNVSLMNFRSDSPYGGRFDELSASLYITQRF